jgi:hypothetical protein
MTKTVRVENADNSSWKVVVQVWDKGFPDGTPDTLVREINLDYPTAMTDSGCYITESRYLVVKEADCKHPNATKLLKSDTGNLCKADDSYWMDCVCPDCGKHWYEDQ